MIICIFQSFQSHLQEKKSILYFSLITYNYEKIYINFFHLFINEHILFLHIFFNGYLDVK